VGCGADSLGTSLPVFRDEIVVLSSRDELSVSKGCNNARLGTCVSKFREDVTVSSLRFDVCRHWAFGFPTFQVRLEASRIQVASDAASHSRERRTNTFPCELYLAKFNGKDDRIARSV